MFYHVGLQPPRARSFSSLFGVFSGKDGTNSAEMASKVVARCKGNWLSHLDWDGHRCVQM